MLPSGAEGSFKRTLERARTAVWQSGCGAKTRSSGWLGDIAFRTPSAGLAERQRSQRDIVVTLRN
jgi:hypothetical protein